MFSKKRKLQILIILFISAILYFSRTMFVAGILMVMAVKGYTVITARTVKLIALLLLSISLLYVYLFSVKLERNAVGFNGFLYKLKMAPGEIFISKINREDHRKLWDHWRAYEASRAITLMQENPMSFLVGTGLGSEINLKFYSPLGDGKKGLKYISEIHNGYIFVFYKTGLIGILFYLFFLIKLYRTSYFQNNYISNLISGIGLFYFFSSLIITGMFNKRDIVVLVLGGLLFFKSVENQLNERK
ncbi:O-antigen ligase family protein [Flavobacterium profundi]|uniref:O-antigen ligase family protein n=1 Tax=Flavobacterium profundi TaxID=1774945 RepID=UPI0015E814D8|nr:O-antigen ligase family protein [Flavobacterium profundi]